MDTGEDEALVRRLLDAMGRGDREAAARFVTHYGPRIRRRVRGKMRESMRRLYDSQDILSTLGRRLDQYVQGNRFQARSVGELWSLIHTITDNSLSEKANILRSLEEKEECLAREHSGCVGHEAIDLSPESEFNVLLSKIVNPMDRQIARLWAMGQTSEQIGYEVGLSPSNVRNRWTRIKTELRRALSGGER